MAGRKAIFNSVKPSVLFLLRAQLARGSIINLSTTRLGVKRAWKLLFCFPWPSPLAPYLSLTGRQLQ